MKTHTSPVLWDNGFHTAKLLEIKPLGRSQGTSQPEHHLQRQLHRDNSRDLQKMSALKKRNGCLFSDFSCRLQGHRKLWHHQAKGQPCWFWCCPDLQHRPTIFWNNDQWKLVWSNLIWAGNNEGAVECTSNWKKTRVYKRTNTAGLALMLRTLCMPARGIQNCLRVIIEYPTASQSFQHENFSNAQSCQSKQVQASR